MLRRTFFQRFLAYDNFGYVSSHLSNDIIQNYQRDMAAFREFHVNLLSDDQLHGAGLSGNGSWLHLGKIPQVSGERGREIKAFDHHRLIHSPNMLAVDCQ